MEAGKFTSFTVSSIVKFCDLKSVALSVPVITGVPIKFWGAPGYAHASICQSSCRGMRLDSRWEQLCQM